MFEHDTNTSVKVVRAYAITDEVETPYQKDAHRLQDNSLKNVVPEVLENDEVDILVMETGNIEISNIKVNEALLDTSKEITEYKNQWFKEVEEDSKKVFEVAKNAIKQRQDLKVIVMKRLPRFDRSSQDILGIKAQLSEYANKVYEQLWLKAGCPQNIHILELNLNTENSKHLRDIIFIILSYFLYFLCMEFSFCSVD